jgi:hypothetical protein
MIHVFKFVLSENIKDQAIIPANYVHQIAVLANHLINQINVLVVNKIIF